MTSLNDSKSSDEFLNLLSFLHLWFPQKYYFVLNILHSISSRNPKLSCWEINLLSSLARQRFWFLFSIFALNLANFYWIVIKFVLSLPPTEIFITSEFVKFKTTPQRSPSYLWLCIQFLKKSKMFILFIIFSITYVWFDSN